MFLCVGRVWQPTVKKRTCDHSELRFGARSAALNRVRACVGVGGRERGGGGREGGENGEKFFRREKGEGGGMCYAKQCG